MRLLILLCLCAAAAAVTHRTMTPAQIAQSEHGWSVCENPRHQLFEVSDVILSPANPKPGSSVNVRVVGVLGGPIADGTLELSVAWGAIELVDKVEPLCEALARSGTPCPVPAGPFVYETTIDLPNDMPRGTFVVSYEALLGNDKRVTCIAMDLVI